MTSNIYEKIDGFNKVISSSSSIAILLLIAKNGRRSFDELEEDTGLDRANLHKWAGELMGGGL